jgi:hypothetical protein
MRGAGWTLHSCRRSSAQECRGGPYGGGAFLNEVDGNLIAKKSDSAVAVHWLGKFRGPEFSEVLFRIQTVRCDRIKDSKGRIIPTVIAEPMGEDARENMAAAARSQEDALLLELAKTPEASLASLATALGWLLRDGTPYKSMVVRAVAKLEKAKLIAKERDGYILTTKGQKVVDSLKSSSPRGSDD